MATASALQCHRILSRALKVALQRGKVVRNVCTLVGAPSLGPFGGTAPGGRGSAAAAGRFAGGAQWRASVALALGLRQGEALGLRGVTSTSSRGRSPCVARCNGRRARGLGYVEPKSKAGRRTVVLPDALREALRAHRTTQLQERMAAGSEWRDDDLVFARVNGRPIDPRRDWAGWKGLLEAAGVRDARLHDARHTAATLLLVRRVASDATRGGIRRVA